MLRSYQITVHAPIDTVPRGDNGRLAQGMFLQTIRDIDPEFSDQLHQSNDQRPYSISRIYREKGTTDLYNIKLSLMGEELNTMFQTYLLRSNDVKVTLNYQPCEVIKVALETHQLPAFASPPVETQVILDFKTPVILSSSFRNEKVDPFPHPDRIWGSLWNTWNDLISPLDPEQMELFMDAMRKQVATPEFELKTVRIKMKHGTTLGLLGRIKYIVEDPLHLEAMLPLANLADIWGIGGKRTRGYGRTNVRIQLPPPKIQQVVMEENGDGETEDMA